MSDIRITVDQSSNSFRPEDVISGMVEWGKVGLDKHPITLNMLYHTSGRGSQDVVEVETLEIPADYGSANFSFPLPSSPVSFSGKLISVSWCLEAINPNTNESCRYDFLLSETGEKVSLEVLPSSNKKGKTKFFDKANR